MTTTTTTTLAKLITSLLHLLVAGSISTTLTTIQAGEVADKPMVWAHYVPWFKPTDSSILATKYYNYPLFRSAGDNTADWAEEFRQAKAQGIDGFMVDVVFGKTNGQTNYSEIVHRMLKAAEGGDFQIAICLDVKTTVERQVRELDRMLTLFGKHPNYPQHGGKPVVTTYTWEKWTPEEWAAIRAGIAAAGHDVYLIANLNRNFTKQDRAWLESWAPHFDMAYLFDLMGIDGVPLRTTTDLVADIAKAHGKDYMAGFSPGYYGAWLNGRNDFYQPHRGFDQLHDCFLMVRKERDRWLHFKTWNDHDETSVLPMLFTSANPLITRAYSDTFKGIAPTATRPEVCLAYHREEIPGTLLRIEALNLPTLAKGSVTARGELLDRDGKPVATLEPRTLTANAAEFARAEWLVPTAPLARSPLLTPRITVESHGFSTTTRLPPVFLVNGWHQNAVTVKVPVNAHVEFPNTLEVRRSGKEEGIVEAAVTFDAGEEITGATLFRNDRPLAVFNGATNNKILFNLVLSGRVDRTLRVSGGEILNAVRRHAEKGSDAFVWSKSEAVSRNARDWTPAGLVCAVTPDTRFQVLTTAGKGLFAFTARELNGQGLIRRGNFAIEAAPLDPAAQSHEPLPADTKKGAFKLSVLTRDPRASDAFYVRYETAGGRVALSDVVYPSATKERFVATNLIQTSVNLETTSDRTGSPGKSEYLESMKNIPFGTTSVVEARIPFESIRAGRWTFDTPGNAGRDSLGDMPVSIDPAVLESADGSGEGGEGSVLRLNGETSLKMRLRTWPIGNATVDFRLNPEPGVTARQSVIGRTGWGDGININLLSDGRLEVVRNGNKQVPVETLVSRGRLSFGEWSRVRVTNDSRHLRIYIDGRLDAEKAISPARSYGNSVWFIGGGGRGYTNYRGKIDDLTVCGAAFASGDADFPGQ
ncbi:laminin G domain-containing protein [Opitutaceae bacterium TAV1]|nr:laminin G domain-containing protein [Opitutaceae bacterium TAV1]